MIFGTQNGTCLLIFKGASDSTSKKDPRKRLIISISQFFGFVILILAQHNDAKAESKYAEGKYQLELKAEHERVQNWNHPWCLAWRDSLEQCTIENKKVTCQPVVRTKQNNVTRLAIFITCTNWEVPKKCLVWTDGCNKYIRDDKTDKSFSLSEKYCGGSAPVPSCLQWQK